MTVSAAAKSMSFENAATAPLAWSSAMAQKALQADFDPALVRLFDGASQAAPHDLMVDVGSELSVDIGGATTAAPRAGLTSPFGFVGYHATDGEVTLARAIGVAETAKGADGQEAIVRLRSNTAHTTDSIAFYRVDDLAGTVEGIAPGQAGYTEAAAKRLYETVEGGTEIAAPTDGGYKETRLVGIDHGDLIAARFSNGTDTFWAFSAANERGADGRAVTHLWNYGLNTWGWEDLPGGGDQDFNDVLVQLDFTSASGSQWLA